MDLDDPVALSAEPGRLHAVAGSGAVVRAVQRADLPGAPVLSGVEVGACGVITGEVIDPAYGDALAQLLIDLGAPVATSMAGLDPGGRFPRSADAVVVVSTSGAERALLDAVQIAAARGSSVTVIAPAGSPIAAVAAERRALLCETDSAEDAGDGAWWAAYAACLGLWRGAPALNELAEDLDEAAASMGPVVATYRNPAKQLAAMRDPALLLATDLPSMLLARLLESELVSADQPVRAVDLRRGTAVLGRLARASAGAHDIFYDPEIDGPGARTWRPVLLPHAGDVARSDAAARVAEHLGPVLAIRTPDLSGPWRAVHAVLLAQLAGAYRDLTDR